MLTINSLTPSSLQKIGAAKIKLTPRTLQRAFTLVEMLVVLVIAGLMATLIVQGFGYSLGLYQKVINSQRTSYSEVLAYGWLRSTLAPQIAARPKDRGLEGNAVQLSGYTFQPLLDHQGLKTLIHWELLQDGNGFRLDYREASTRFTVYRWPESSGRFEYLNSQGQWQKAWPPDKTDSPSLPEAIRLVVATGAESRHYVVSISTRKRPEVTMDEVLYGR